jgi:hypothetical protein
MEQSRECSLCYSENILCQIWWNELTTLTTSGYYLVIQTSQVPEKLCNKEEDLGPLTC